MKRDWKKFRDLLDANYKWPSTYLFKFITPKDKYQQLLLIIGTDVTIKASKEGRFLSITAERLFDCAEDVIEIYIKVGQLTGVIAL